MRPRRLVATATAAAAAVASLVACSSDPPQIRAPRPAGDARFAGVITAVAAGELAVGDRRVAVEVEPDLEGRAAVGTEVEVFAHDAGGGRYTLAGNDDYFVRVAQPAWPVPAGWRREVIAMPLAFAPTLAHHGVEEVRFPPGFFDRSSPNRWSYAFVWYDRGDAPADLAAELAAYFRGLLAEVDGDKHRFDPAAITAAVAADATVTIHAFDAFTDGSPIDLVGTARHASCAAGSIWVFTLAPAGSPLRATLDSLAASAACATPAHP